MKSLKHQMLLTLRIESKTVIYYYFLKLYVYVHIYIYNGQCFWTIFLGGYLPENIKNAKISLLI